MRFITEFELSSPFEIKNYKGSRERGSAEWLGLDIAKAFGWEKKNGIVPNYPTSEMHSLEIEAFPMKDYLAFKENMINYLSNIGVNPKVIKDRFVILESIGKPSGDAITNLADQMEYRGPNSHCKACEDEKNGVKYIMAQKHTCNK